MSDAENRAAPAALAVRARRVEGAPVVAVRVWARGGARCEATPGQALVAGRSLIEGTSRRDWSRIAAEAEARGVTLTAGAGWDVQSLAVDGLAVDWRLALEWAAELTWESAFPDDRCRWVARQARAELESLADHPEVVTDWAFRRLLYGEHPRGRPLQGTTESLASLDGAACHAFHRQSLAAGLIVCVAGAIDPDEVLPVAESLFARPAEADPPAAPPPVVEALAARRETHPVTGEQAHVVLGGLSVRRGDPLLPQLEALAVILGAGSGLVGRIPGRVREAEGLAYDCHVATTAGSGLDPGRFEVYAATDPDQADRAERVVREELERLVDGEPLGAEFEEARSYLLGREPFRRETARQWAAILGEAELYGVPVDRPHWVHERISEIGERDVAAAAARILAPGRLQVTLGLPG